MTSNAKRRLRLMSILRSYSKNSINQLMAAGGDELKVRRLTKRYYAQVLVIWKLYARELKKAFEDGDLAHEVFKQLRLA